MVTFSEFLMKTFGLLILITKQYFFLLFGYLITNGQQMYIGLIRCFLNLCKLLFFKFYLLNFHLLFYITLFCSHFLPVLGPHKYKCIYLMYLFFFIGLTEKNSNLKIVYLVLFGGLLKTYVLEAAFQISLKDYSKDVRKEWGYTGIFQQNHDSQNIKRLLLIREKT